MSNHFTGLSLDRRSVINGSTSAISTPSSRPPIGRGPRSSSMQIRMPMHFHPDAIYRVNIDNDGDC